MDIIKAMNLKKYYTSDTYEVRALDGVSLIVEEGEFIAVVGTSGCGKTTLMNISGLFHELSMGRSNLLHPCYHISHIVSDSLVM